MVHAKFAIRWAYAGSRPTYGSGRSMPAWWDAVSGVAATVYSYGLPFAFVGSFILMMVGLLRRTEPPYAVVWAGVALTAPVLGWALVLLCLWTDPLGAFNWWAD